LAAARSTLVTDAGLEHLTACPRLEWLWLTNTAVSDEGLAHLKRVPNLKWLRLEYTQVTDAGLVELRGSLNCDILISTARTSAARGLPNFRVRCQSWASAGDPL